jgi:hypothetical protein
MRNPLRHYLLRRRLHRLMPRRRDPFFRMLLKARHLMALESFGQARAVPDNTGSTVRFTRPTAFVGNAQ